MGINPVALLAHQLDLKGLLQLIHRLPPVAGQSWEYLEQPPASETLNGLWNKVEKVSFGSPECALDIGPRSAALHFFAKMGGDDMEFWEPILGILEKVAGALGSPAAAMVPDSGHELMAAVEWVEDGWSLAEILATLPEIAPRVPDLCAMRVSRDKYWEIGGYATLHWADSELPAPPPGHDQASAEEVLASLDFDRMEYFRYGSRILLTGFSRNAWPANQQVFLHQLSQDASVLLVGVRRFRLVDEQKGAPAFTRDSEWLSSYRSAHPEVNPSLAHYRFEQFDSQLEVLACAHFIERQPHPDPRDSGGQAGTVIRIPR